MYRLLDQSIYHRRDAKLSHPFPVRLRYLYLQHRLRSVFVSHQLFFDPLPFLLQVWLQLLNRHSIYSGCASVAHHSLECGHHVLSLDHCFHQLLGLRAGVFSHCRDSCRTQLALSLFPTATLRVGIGLLSHTICVSCRHRNLRLLSVSSCSGLRSGRYNLLCPLLTSASPSRHLSITVVLDRLTDLPGYCALTFPLMPAAYTFKLSVQVSDFEDMRLLIQLARLVCGFCSSGQRFACGFLQIPPRGGHPCRPANYSPCRASRGLSPPSKCALPGARIGERVGGNVNPFVRAGPAESVPLPWTRCAVVRCWRPPQSRRRPFAQQDNESPNRCAFGCFVDEPRPGSNCQQTQAPITGPLAATFSL